ncbi:VOC family protein [Cupriavidus necator]|uniref:VOC family protein n=1 Tax=Cupriavidus necator TaxID=106590 RepID=UPI0039C47395
MLKVSRPTPSHFGIYVTDLPKMVAFYTETFGLTITDRGEGRTFRNQLVFTSASPDQHHQLVLASGRPPEAKFSTVMQISFAVPSIQDLRDISAKAIACGASNVRGLNHGNALSVYMLDPEGNMVEIYVDTPFYVAQPHGDPLDLSKDDETILRETEEACRRDPTFLPIEVWQAQFDAKRRQDTGA